MSIYLQSAENTPANFYLQFISKRVRYLFICHTLIGLVTVTRAKLTSLFIVNQYLYVYRFSKAIFHVANTALFTASVSFPSLTTIGTWSCSCAYTHMCTVYSNIRQRSCHEISGLLFYWTFKTIDIRSDVFVMVLPV